MKGLLVSLLTTVFYELSVAIAIHVRRPKQHMRVFAQAGLLWSMGYLILYFATPTDFYFLPPAWQCSVTWLDVFYGLVIFILNCHNFGDVVGCVSSEFSISLLVLIHQSHAQTVTTDKLVAPFNRTDGTDNIYAWRVSHLTKRGYIIENPTTQNFSLTAKGRMIALVVYALKRLMNLGEGG